MKPSKALKKAYKQTEFVRFKAFVRAQIKCAGELSGTADQWRKNKGYSAEWVRW